LHDSDFKGIQKHPNLNSITQAVYPILLFLFVGIGICINFQKNQSNAPEYHSKHSKNKTASAKRLTLCTLNLKADE